jgi:hypothetical protein
MSDYYEELKKLGIPLSVDAAVDILVDDGMEMAVAAWRLNRDPESLARHVVKLRKAARGD